MPLFYTIRVTLQDGSQIALDHHDEADALRQYHAITEEDADRLRLQRVELFARSEDHQIYIRRKAGRQTQNWLTLGSRTPDGLSKRSRRKGGDMLKEELSQTKRDNQTMRCLRC